MPKTGLKTFVYSFSVSLFAIFAANGMYWHDRPTKTSDIKIPSGNIMLFLKNDAINPSIAVAPVKKIALSVLPEIKREAPSIAPDDEIIMADDLDIPEIPLEFSVPTLEATPQEQLPPLRLAENAAPKPKLMRQQTEEVKQPDRVVIPLEIPESKGIGRPRKAEDLPSSPSLKVSKQETINQEAEISAPTPLLARETPSAGTETYKGDVSLLASSEIPLLPLERSKDDLPQSQNIVRIASTVQSEQVALADKSVPILSMEKKPALPVQSEPSSQTPAWEDMADKKSSTDSPWLVAKADGALKNQKLSQEAFYKKNNKDISDVLNPGAASAEGVKLASETVKNLLIPIPEDILNDENLTPQLSYTPKDSSSKEKTATDEPSVENRAAPQKNAALEKTTLPKAEENADSQKNKLLASLDAIFSAKEQKKAEPKKEEKSSILSSLRKKIQKKSSVGKIMPTEMRLSFQPNRAEISGQTLRWIQAFASKAAEDKNMTIEIRIDGTSAMDLQQKRLNLLHNILTDKGVEYSKINTVFTQREPNSFIIKTITHNNQKGANRNLNKAADGYYIQW